ncbi:Anaerobic glycerol-3-phosphate dehydrogenase subunit C [compost metagenome]
MDANRDVKPAAAPARLRVTMLPEAARSLEADLRAVLRGEVRFDAESKALYATDASNYRQVPIGVVIPQDTEDVVRTVEVCRRHRAPIVSRGGGTSLAGQTCNTAIVIDFSKVMHQLISLDPEAKSAKVQPGIILDDLRNAAEAHGLTFGPDPATHNRCTLGGMIGNDSCGMHAQMAGRTSQNIEGLEILTYDGTRMRVKNRYTEEAIEAIIQEGGRPGAIFAQLRDLRDRYADRIRTRFPKIPRLVSGYGLQFLLPENGFNVAASLVGSEGTCVTILEAQTRLVESPAYRTLVLLGYPSVYEAGDHVKDILPFGPIALEGLDDYLFKFMTLKGMHPEYKTLLPEGKGWLMVELGGETQAEADQQADRLMDALKKVPSPPSMRRYSGPKESHRLWEIREAGLGATSFVPRHGDSWPGWEDSAVPPEHVGSYLRDLRKLFDAYGYEASLYGHFGQGCVHCSVDFDLESADGIRNFREFLDKAARLVVSYGGSLSGEHGDGQARGELLPLMFGEDLVQAFREFKAIWDPEGMMNPGKVVDAYPITSNLRLGGDYQPPQVETHFKFPDDQGSFAHATLRCVGVGLCRRLEGGTMCPSYMVTREEEHTTRGRAHSLFEMMKGEILKGGWKDDGVKQALDLCLACKGCKSDCPVNVDMATYKAEFLSHYYEGRLRPMSAYSMGLITWWARLAALMPRLANAVTQTPGLSHVVKRLGGIAPQRQLPRFAEETFREWFARREPRNPDGPPVLLWADTFNNHFHPAIAKAAVDVLERLGYQVQLSEQVLCCGRPLYDHGFLDQAKGLLEQIMTALESQLGAGIPIVGLEPSCVAVFRDELTNLYPEREVARKLSRQVMMLSEFLEREAKDVPLPKLDRKAVVHGHCHHKAIMTLDAETAVLERLGLDYEVLDSGCCGMAGSFGFEPDHLDVSLKAGERVLLPAVRAADPETLIVTDGFSCHEQIAQGTTRRAMHLAEVLQLAFRQGEAQAPEEKPRGLAIGEIALLAGGLALVGILAFKRRQRKGA